MPHARTQIRDAAVSALTGLTTTGARVYGTRLYPYGPAHLPGLAIYANSEERDEEGDVMGDPSFRRLTLVVEGRVIANSAVDDTLDAISSEVEAALEASSNLGGLVKYLAWESTELELSAEDSEQVVGRVAMQFNVLYRAASANPDVMIS